MPLKRQKIELSYTVPQSYFRNVTVQVRLPSIIGVGRFRILGAGGGGGGGGGGRPMFRILGGGARGAKFPAGT